MSGPVQVPGQGSVVLGIRPEDVRLPRAGDTTTLRGDVFLVENLGMAHLISLRLKGANPLTLRVLLPADATLEPRPVRVSPACLHPALV